MLKMYRVLGKRGRITIPFELRMSVGFKSNDVLSFTKQDDRTIVVRKEKICDNCNEQETVKNDEEVTLLEFLNGLSDEQKRAALIHLSVQWAEKQGGNLNVGKSSII